MLAVFRGCLHAVYGVCLLVMAVLHGGKYDWMYGADPTPAAGGIVDASDNRAVFSGTLLAIALFAQMLAAATGQRLGQRVLSSLLGLVGIAVFAWARL